MGVRGLAARRLLLAQGANVTAVDGAKSERLRASTQSLADADVTVYGDGSQTRSIQHVSDLATGISKLMLSEVTTPVNIGNPAEMTMLQLAEKIIQSKIHLMIQMDEFLNYYIIYAVSTPVTRNPFWIKL